MKIIFNSYLNMRWNLKSKPEKNKVQALSILTVSDSLISNESTSSEERQNTFIKMVEIALETIKS